MFSLFRRLPTPSKPDAAQNEFLTQALAKYNSLLENADRDWRFPEGERWDFDQKRACFRLHFPDGSRIEADAQLVGSFHAKSHIWEWAWNNPKLPASLTHECLQVKEKGQQERFDLLRLGKFEAIDPKIGQLLSAAAASVLGSQTVFAGSDGPLVLYISLKNLRRIQSP